MLAGTINVPVDTGHGLKNKASQKAHAAWATLAFSLVGEPMLFDLVEAAKNPPEDAPPPPPVVQQKAAPVVVAPRPPRRMRRRGPDWWSQPSNGPPPPSQPRTSITLQRKTLPAHKEASNVIDTVSKYQVMFIEGGTGCGKTTQVPQFLLDSAEGPIKIVVAQPRRVAAVGVASRVAEERGENVGRLSE